MKTTFKQFYKENIDDLITGAEEYERDKYRVEDDNRIRWVDEDCEAHSYNDQPAIIVKGSGTKYWMNADNKLYHHETHVEMGLWDDINKQIIEISDDDD